jgi:uncharacterized membrane protein
MFKLNDTDFIHVWQVLRKNKFLFVFRNGCLNWAMPAYLIALIFSAAIWNDNSITFQRLVIGAIVFIFAGLAMGLMLYATNEKRFAKLTSTNSK